MSLRGALVLLLDDPALAEVRARFDPVGTAAGIPLHIRAAAAPLLPVAFEVREAALLAERAPDAWHEVRRFPFRGGA